MSVLSAVLDAARSGAVEIIDLTTPLQESTPILELPPPLANTSRFRLQELSRYDDRGPAWYWNDKLPPTGCLLIICPLPIVRGSGSPARALALVER
jgi:kynurenine formamidase